MNLARKIPFEDQLNNRVFRDPNSGCWLWEGRLHLGYGHWSVNKKSVLAHRHVYEKLVGPIPPGLHIDHKCRVRCCVNPAHMEPVTKKENTFRGANFVAANKRKTHCTNGHELSSGNIYPSTAAKGWRVCIQCSHATTARNYRERKARNALASKRRNEEDQKGDKPQS